MNWSNGAGHYSSGPPDLSRTGSDTTGPPCANAYALEYFTVDHRHFDALARVLSTVESRRGLLTSLPVLGGLFAILTPEETEAAGRRKRRKKAHKHGKGRWRKHHKMKQCTPESVAQTCAGTYGSVTNNCKQLVDCGACACTPLTECPVGKGCGTFPDGCGGFVTCPITCDNPTPACTDNVCSACTADAQCASDEICAGGECVTGIGTCAAGDSACLAFVSCNGDPDCFCLPTQAGATRCVRYYEEGPYGFRRPRTVDTDCSDLGAGAFCPPKSNSCGGVCSLPC